MDIHSAAPMDIHSAAPMGIHSADIHAAPAAPMVHYAVLRRLLVTLLSHLWEYADAGMPLWLRAIPELLTEHVYGQIMLMRGRARVPPITTEGDAVDIGFQSPSAATLVDQAAHAIAAVVTVVSVEMFVDDQFRVLAYDYPYYGAGGDAKGAARSALISEPNLVRAAQVFVEDLWTSGHGVVDVYAQPFERRRPGTISSLMAKGRLRLRFIDGSCHVVQISRCSGEKGGKKTIAVGAVVWVWSRCAIRREGGQCYTVTYESGEVEPCSDYRDIRPVVTADQLRIRYCAFIEVMVWRAYGNGGPTLLGLDPAGNATPSCALHARMMQGACSRGISEALLHHLAGVVGAARPAVCQWLLSRRTSNQLQIFMYYNYDALVNQETNTGFAMDKALALASEYAAASSAVAAAAGAAQCAARMCAPRPPCYSAPREPNDDDHAAEMMREVIGIMVATSGKRKVGGAQHSRLLVAVALVMRLCRKIRKNEIPGSVHFF